MKIAVFASGSGSNFAAITEAIRQNRLQGVQIEWLVCDKPGAFVIMRAEQEGVPVFSFQAKDYPDKQAYEQVIVERLQEKNVELIVLAGYMRLVGKTLLQAYQDKVINLHPSLLPAFQGKDAIGQALEYGVKVTGVTVHIVDHGMDTGPIIAQQIVMVDPKETKESLMHKVQEQEHKLLPEVIGWFAKGLIHQEGRKVVKR